jgi:hypothetical protein
MKAVVVVGPNTSNINEAKQEWSLSAFPNPAENFINIKAEGVNGKVGVTVLNIIGAEVVLTATVDVTNYRINIADLNQGTYFIRIENGDRTKVVRFMKK